MLKIIEQRKAAPREWDAIAGQCDYATYFHSREWSEIWRDYTLGKVKPDARVITFSDGVEALLPFSSRTVIPGLLLQFVSSSEWTYGGWLSASPLTTNHRRLIQRYLSNLDLRMRCNPFDPSTYDDLSSDGARALITSDHTHAIDLRRGFEAIEMCWEQRGGALARKIRKARRDGVVVELARDIDEWREYFDVYQESQARWGEVVGIPYSWELFDILRKRQSPRISLWLARSEGQISAGAICFSVNRHVVYWHGASRTNARRLRAANLLHARIIEDACDRGFWWYDFNPSASLEGVIAFKKSFGAEEKYAPMLINHNARRRVIEKLKDIRGIVADQWRPKNADV